MCYLSQVGLSPIEREGNILWRPARPWNAAIHQLLTHLHDVGFDGVPRSFGIDDDGRHRLSWVEGDEGDPAGDGDEQLASFARLIRRYHEAFQGFDAPVGLQIMVGAPASGPIVCHNDLAPANTILVRGVATTLIDWDLAAPGDERWDLAYAAWRSVPLYDDTFFTSQGRVIPDRARRLRLFADAYGLAERNGFVELIARRIRSLYDTAKEWGGQGQPGWVDVWRDTRGRQWLASLEFAQRNARSWAAALTE